MAQIIIQKGQTLGTLAKQYGTTVADIMAANKGNASVKTQDLIYAGGNLNIPEKVSAPATGPLKESPAGTLTPPVVQNAGATQNVATQGSIGDFASSMRNALNEGSRQRSQNRFDQLMPVGQGLPIGSLASIAEMAKQSANVPAQAIFSDAMSAYKASVKAVELNPAEYKEVQGGLYNIRTNEWVINPKKDKVAGGTSVVGGQTISSTTKQILDGFTHLEDLTPSDQEKPRTELFALGFNEQNPPSWFQGHLQQTKPMTFSPSGLQNEWNDYRATVRFGKKFLNADFFSSVFSKSELSKQAKAANMSEEAYLNYLEGSVQAWRDQGFSDIDIKKMMQ
jgi:hypothetical protein